MTKAQRDIKRKLLLLGSAQESGNISKTCRAPGLQSGLKLVKDLLPITFPEFKAVAQVMPSLS